MQHIIFYARVHVCNSYDRAIIYIKTLLSIAKVRFLWFYLPLLFCVLDWSVRLNLKFSNVPGVEKGCRALGYKTFNRNFLHRSKIDRLSHVRENCNSNQRLANLTSCLKFSWIRECSNIIWRFGRRFVQTVRMPSYGEKGWLNRHITFMVAENLNSQFFLLYLRYMWGRGLVENVICGGGLKYFKKTSMIFERFLALAHMSHRCARPAIFECKMLKNFYAIRPFNCVYLVPDRDQ